MTPTNPPRLAAMDFDRHVARLTQDFTGREWLFREVDRWMGEQDQRFFLLVGDAAGNVYCLRYVVPGGGEW